jgi:hypothetical protein
MENEMRTSVEVSYKFLNTIYEKLNEAGVRINKSSGLHTDTSWFIMSMRVERLMGLKKEEGEIIKIPEYFLKELEDKFLEANTRCNKEADFYSENYTWYSVASELRRLQNGFRVTGIQGS